MGTLVLTEYTRNLETEIAFLAIYSNTFFWYQGFLSSYKLLG